MKVGDILELDMDFDGPSPLAPFMDYPIVVEAVHADGTVDLVFDPDVLPMRMERTDLALMGLRLRQRVGREHFDAAIASFMRGKRAATP